MEIFAALIFIGHWMNNKTELRCQKQSIYFFQKDACKSPKLKWRYRKMRLDTILKNKNVICIKHHI